MTPLNNNPLRHQSFALALALAVAALPALAIDFTLGEEIEGRFTMTTTLGTAIRTESPDPRLYGVTSGATAGIGAGQLSGNAGTSDLNFRRGFHTPPW
jgi:hypothetical protein